MLLGLMTLNKPDEDAARLEEMEQNKIASHHLFELMRAALPGQSFLYDRQDLNRLLVDSQVLKHLEAHRVSLARCDSLLR